MTDFSPFGTDLFGDPIRPPGAGIVAERFIMPPFSVLSSREGEWQARKRAWLSLGIQSELGRDDGVTFAVAAQDAPDSFFKDVVNQRGGATSIFDPVLAELFYTWFCPPGGVILDPFAGGSVRGIVAGMLGFTYWGCDLSARQIQANREQHESIDPALPVTWVHGDSMDTLADAPAADFIFSCPPYGDLEVYSDDPRDLSTMEYHTFVAAYERIILRATAKLRHNSFACFVVGDFRDKAGHMRTFVHDTQRSFNEVGLRFYNHAIFVTPAGSLPVRITKQFETSRKMGKTHQDVLVFVKGDARAATKKIQPQQESKP